MMNQRVFSALFAASMVVAPAFAHAQPAIEVSHDPASVQAGVYDVEPVHTRVLFSVSHLGFTTWYGDFTGVSGTLDLDPKKVGASTLEIHIPVESISTTNAKLDGELKGDQWFDAGHFPEIAFKSTKIMQTGKGIGKVTGDLTFHGVTKPVTLAVKFNGAGVNPMTKKYTAGFEVSGKIKRSDFGIKTYVPLVGDDVDLIISAAFEHR
jgi:polyisoprenoid-binding protein YceI